MRGGFRLKWANGEEEFVSNSVLDEAEESFLKMIFQADTTDVAAGGNFYIGLCGNLVVSENVNLANVTDEVPVSNNYARQPITRDATGWPTIEQVDPYWRALSASVTFTATPGDYGATFTRLFLCNVVSGTSGLLFSFSAPLTTPRLVTPTNPFSAQYEFYLA